MTFPNQNNPSPGTDKGKQGASPAPEKAVDKGDKAQKADPANKPSQSDPQKQRTPQ